MADDAENLTLEEQRLAFEERKWADEFSLRKLEMETKAREGTWAAKLFSPLTATIMAGILTVAGSVAATLIQNAHSLRLEQQRFDATKDLEKEKFLSSKTLDIQKQQHEMILKMIGVEDVDQARKNLRFLAETELIADRKLAERLLAAKETPLIRPSSTGTSLSSILPTVTPEEFKRRVSEDAIKMIIGFEGGADGEKFESNRGRPILSSSGVPSIVIGISYDLGLVTPDKFQSDWGPYLGQADMARLAAAVGVRGAIVRGLHQQLQDVSIRWEDAVAVFVGRVLPEHAARLETSLPNVRDLPQHSYGALLSLIFNRGSSFSLAGDRYQEMRRIREAMAARQFSEIPGQIRAMTRLWPNMKALMDRREAEANLFEKGLGPQLASP